MLAVASGDYGKPRPCVVVQATELMEFSDSILLCPVTSQETGLREPSEVLADKPMAAKRERIRQVIGRVPDRQMNQINAALALILGLRGQAQP